MRTPQHAPTGSVPAGAAFGTGTPSSTLGPPGSVPANFGTPWVGEVSSCVGVNKKTGLLCEADAIPGSDTCIGHRPRENKTTKG